MNVWYFNHYAGSCADYNQGRSYYLCDELTRLGANCVIIASSWHHYQLQHNDQTEDFLYKKIDGIEYVWLKTNAYTGNGVARINNMLAYSAKCWHMDRLELEHTPDVVIISSVHPFHLFAGIKLARKYKAKLVFEVRDLWPLTLNELIGLSRLHPLSLLLSFIERIGCRYADLIVSVLSNASEYFAKLGVQESRYLYLPNGFPSNYHWDANNVYEQELKAIRKQYKRIVMHTGSMGPPNGLDQLILAANELQDESIAFVLVGNGIEKNNLQNMTRSSNVYFFPSVAKTQIQSVLSYADICFWGGKPLPTLYHYGVSANKVFDYMLAKKYIVYTVKAKNNPVEMASAGELCESLQDLIFALRKLLRLDDEELMCRGEKGYQYLVLEHDFRNLGKRLYERLLRLLNNEATN